MGRNASAVIAAIALACLWYLLQDSKPSGPRTQLTVEFNGDLSVLVDGESSLLTVHEGMPEFRKGAEDLAYFNRGEGDWIGAEFKEPLTLSKQAKVSFWIKAEDWINPYKGGSGTQTVMALSNQDANGWHYLTINLGPRSRRLSVHFDSADNDSVSAAAEEGINLNWHFVEVRFTADTSTTELWIDDKQVAVASGRPIALMNGVTKLQIGTWFKKNQAFRGAIDSLVIFGE